MAHTGSTGEAICRSYPVPKIGSYPPYPYAFTGIKADMGSPGTSGLVDVSELQGALETSKTLHFFMGHTLCSYRKTLRIGMVVHICNPSTQELEAGR